MGDLYWLKNLNGATWPWLVASEAHLDSRDQPKRFVLKNFRDGEGQRRYTEFVATKVACELGIGAPRVTLLEVTAEFLDRARLLPEMPRGLLQAQPGVQMAVSWYDDAPELVHHLPYGQIPNLKSRSQLGGIIGADTLLQNDDRNRGNLLVRGSAESRSTRRVLVPIDWGLAFEGNKVDREDLQAIVGKRRIYGGDTFLLRHIRSADDFTPFLVSLQAFLNREATLRSIVDWVPESWNVPQRWKDALYEHILKRGEIVSERLRRYDDPERVFPEWQYIQIVPEDK